MIFLQRTFTSLVHAHAGRTQLNKLAHFVRWDAYTQGGFAIMPYVYAPVIEKLGVIYLQHKKVGLTMTLKHQGCFARLSLRLALVAV